jgi:uncharacterized protein YecE (DUF72 family)
MNDINVHSIPLEKPLFYIGTSGWTYDHWKGSFYPDSLPKKRWFEYYTSQFSAVEVNATFYRPFKDETYQNWKERAPHGFGYVLKAPKLITHRKYLVDVEQDIKTFYRSCTLLNNKFEMILLQIAPNMPCDLKRLEATLHAFPDPGRVAVEFRRSEWLNQATLSILREVGSTIVNVDSPLQKLSDHLTSDRAYIRLHGRKQWYSNNYNEDEIREIASHAKELAQRGAKRVYVFFNNDFEGYAPANALTLCELLQMP